MKTFCRFAVTLCCISASFLAYAQPWSDVGVPGFTSNIITNASVNYAPDFAIHSNTKYAIYIDNNQLPVVMVNTTGTWTAMASVNAGAITAAYPSIEVDATGTPYISYVNSAAFKLVVKKFDGTNWVLVGTANFGLSNAWAGHLALDGTGTPYIAYYRNGMTNRISVMKFDGTNWVNVGATDFSASTNFLRMRISPAGTPYVAYVDASNSSKLSVQKFNGTSWVFEGPQAFTSTTNISQLDIAINSSNTPHVVYYSTNAPNKLNTVKFDGANWVAVGAADFTPGTTFQPKIKISSTGVPHVVFRDNSVSGRCSVMKFNGTSWVNAGDVGFSGGAAQNPAIDFDASGNPHVLFQDGLLNNKSTVMKLCTSSTATVSSTTPGSVCGSGTVTLGATSATGTLRWYDAATNGNYVSTGTSCNTASLSTTTTYSVAAYDANGCTSARTAVVATVKILPTITNSTLGSNCGTGTISLSATVSSGSINWFAGATGGSTLGTGTTYTTPSISNTTTYYAEGLDAGCASATRTAVIATVNSIPSAPSTTGGSRCGSGSVILNASAPSGTINWYTASSGGASLGTGTSYGTNNLSNTTTFYAGVTSGAGCSGSRTAAIATVNPLPSVNSATNGARCGTGTVVLNAIPSAGAIHWYAQSTGGSALATGNSFTTPSISATTNFYAEAVNNGCASIGREAVLATIQPFPTVTASDGERCDAGTVTLTGSSDGNISWFADEVGGVALGTGTSFTTPSLNFTTPYYVQATLDNCTSAPRIQVFATVNPTPSQPTITSNNANIEAPVLTSSSTTGNQWFKNNTAISGATSNTLTIADAGTYKVQVTTLGCISPFSLETVYVITGTEPSTNGIQVYPNPASNEVIISLTAFERNKDVQIVVTDLLGREYQRTTKTGGEEARIQIRNWQAGQYVVLLHQGHIHVARTFIKSL